jgi:hypothetical protein
MDRTLLILVCVSASFAAPLGDWYEAGSTVWDIQANGSAGRMINVLADGRVQLVWTSTSARLTADTVGHTRTRGSLTTGVS